MFYLRLTVITETIKQELSVPVVKLQKISVAKLQRRKSGWR